MRHLSKIVAKTWGQETWFVNRDYCGKRLIFAEDHRCSAHFHKNKHEVFLVTHGRIQLETFRVIKGLTRSNETVSIILPKGAYILEVGQTAEIPPGCIHRMTALCGNAAMIEFSSHHEDSDSYRVQSGQCF
jgi:mannose-6-phosphate isomerase-like protein (cupin superfamily)